MTLSAVTLASRERSAADLAAFSLTGVPYIMWRTTDFVASRLWWRQHTGVEGAEVSLDRQDTYVEVAAVGRNDNATVLIVFTKGAGDAPVLYATIASVATGATVVAPFAVAAGTRPALAALFGDGSRVALVYRDGQTSEIHIRETYDGGLTWQTAKPVLNNKVNASIDLSLVTFDGTHLSIGQVGESGKSLAEDGSASRSRPVSEVLVTAPGRIAVIEPTIRTGQVADNVRGRAALDGAGNVITTSRARVGTDDTIGSLAVYDTVYDTPALVGSAILAAGAAPGGEIVRAPFDPPGAGAVIASVAGSEAVIDLTVFDGHALYAAHATTALTGRAGWVNLSTLAAGEFGLGAGVTRVGAIAAGVAAAGGFDLLAVGYTASGAQYLRLGEWLNPPSGVTLGAIHAMPAKVNSLAVSVVSSVQASIFVGMADRVNVYAFDGIGKPIRLIRSHLLLTGGEVHQLQALDSGNVVAALGVVGVAVFGPGGETLAVARPSSVPAMPWKPLTAYTAGALVRPTDAHPYAPQRRYFICSRSGTSGVVEPSWGPSGDPNPGGGGFSGTTNDPNGAGAGWQEVGSALPIITGVAVSQEAGRVYATGVLGGASGTTGRVYNLDAGGLVSAPVRTAPPQFSLHEGEVVNSIWRLTILSGTPGATIYYTLDGSTPGPNAAVYDPLVGLLYEKSGNYHVRAVAVSPDLRPSVKVELHFTIDLPDLPPVLINPDFGAYFDQTFDVDLACAEPGVVIRYTTDGSTPTESTGLVYGGPFHIDNTTIIRARGFKYGYDDTPLLAGQITITRPLIPRDPAPISHFLVSAGVLVDLGAASWQQWGTVPKVASAPILGKYAEGMGPFTDANFYELVGSTAGTDIFDTLMAGDFTMTFIIGGGQSPDVIFSAGRWGNGGFYLQHYPGGGVKDTVITYYPYQYWMDQAGLGAGAHVMTFARKGTNHYMKLDKNPVTTNTGFAPSGWVNGPVRIGRYPDNGNPYRGTFYEARFINTGPASTADLDALHAAIIP